MLSVHPVFRVRPDQPEFSTTVNRGVYITAAGCEIEFGGAGSL
jgi:hypothetical protein